MSEGTMSTNEPVVRPWLITAAALRRAQLDEAKHLAQPWIDMLHKWTSSVESMKLGQCLWSAKCGLAVTDGIALQPLTLDAKTIIELFIETTNKQGSTEDRNAAYYRVSINLHAQTMTLELLDKTAPANYDHYNNGR